MKTKQTVATEVKASIKALGIKAKVRTRQTLSDIYCYIETTDLPPSQRNALDELAKNLTDESQAVYILTFHNTTKELETKVLNFYVDYYANPSQTNEELQEIAKPHILNIIKGKHALSDKFWN